MNITILICVLVAKGGSGDGAITRTRRALGRTSTRVSLFLGRGDYGGERRLRSGCGRNVTLRTRVGVLKRGVSSFGQVCRVSRGSGGGLLGLTRSVRETLPSRTRTVSKTRVRERLSLGGDELLRVGNRVNRETSVNDLRERLARLAGGGRRVATCCGTLSLTSRIVARSTSRVDHSFTPELERETSRLLGQLAGNECDTLDMSGTCRVRIGAKSAKTCHD